MPATVVVLEPWLGPVWRERLDVLLPWLEWMRPALESSAGWAGGMVPVLIWIVWGMGALVLLGLTAAAGGGVWWWRRRKPAHPV